MEGMRNGQRKEILVHLLKARKTHIALSNTHKQSTTKMSLYAVIMLYFLMHATRSIDR